MFLSRLIFSILISVSMVARMYGPTVETVTALVHNPPLLLIVGMIGLIGGLAIVLGHNIWSGAAAGRRHPRRLVNADPRPVALAAAAGGLREPSRSKLQAIIRQYAQLRLDLTRGPWRPRDIEEALTEFGRMHEQMTTLVAQALKDGTPIAVSLANTLNSLTSNQASRLAAYRDHLPASIVFLLYISAIVTALMIGRGQGVDGSSDIAGTVCFVLVVNIAIYVTLDLNRPEGGLIRVSQEPIEQLLTRGTIQ
jgi:hypothetical protein